MLKFILFFIVSTFIFLGDVNAAACTPANPTNCYTLQLHYTFDEGSNLTTADQSGNNRTGTLSSSNGNNPVWVASGSNYYLDFTRSDGTRVTSPSFTPPADGVVAFWLKIPPKSPVRRRIFGFGDGWEIRWESDNVMYLDINKTGTNSSIRTSSAITATNTWMHIAVMTNTTNNTWSVYINGEPDNNGSETLTAQPNSPLTIGTRTGSNDFLDGSIDDFRIYSGVLTPTEIEELAAVSPDCCLAYPYETDFEGSNVEWDTTNSDWDINASGHAGWQARSGNTFLDNNPNEIDQEYHRNQYATLTKSVFIPLNANIPTLSYYYKAGIFSGQIYSMISTNGTNWSTLETFVEQDNHGEYTKREVNLNNYKGQNVQIRFRQYHNSGSGPRLFVIDDFRIGDFQSDDYSYPYFNDFESTQLREHFNYEGDWNVSTSHDTEWYPSTGSYFLDNNYNNEDQSQHYNQYTTMNGFVTLPSGSANPMISFDYLSNIFEGYVYLQIQEYGSNTWTYLKVFSDSYNHKPYTKFEYHLNNYLGKKVRFRFRQYWYSVSGARVFPIDNIFIGELTDALPFPYANNFETTTEQAEWHTEGDWNISTAHDTKWFPSNGSAFLDNNADNEDQANKRDHYATMSGYIPLPADSTNVVVSFDYLLNVFGGQTYLYVQKLGQSNWTYLKVFTEEFNRDKYTKEEISLAAYGGEKVRFRFRQYYYSDGGPRVFSIDNFKVEIPTIGDYPYPYFNDFETEVSTPSINGQDQWKSIGDWDISQAHDTIYVPESGLYFLDNNYNNVDQANHRNHYTTMDGYIALPAAPANPMISFDYTLDIFDGYTYLQIQEEGSNTWRTIKAYTTYDNHKPYTKFEAFLSNFSGKKVRFRFRQYHYSSTGPRVFSVDNVFVGELTDTLPYPYSNTFESVSEQEEFNVEGDWAISTAHDTHWFPHSGSYFLDNNANNEDQNAHREHFATLSGYIPLPADTSNVVVSFNYLLNAYDGQSYIYIQKLGDSTWTHLKTYNSSLNHSDYARDEISLAAYAGQQVRFRFRQYYYNVSGPRVFTVDNFHVGEPTIPDFQYPYFNDFETPISTSAVNGQDHWNHQGDWNISTAHDGIYKPKNGSYFLDNNADNENQGGHYNHYVDLGGYVPIDANANNPQLSFWYNANVFNGWTFLQIQEKGSNTWRRIYSFSDSLNHNDYTKFYYDLDAYKGKSVRIRFRQYWYNTATGPRVFSIDDFRIGDDDRINLNYPYENTFETIKEREEFIHEGDWGISTAHDTDYVPYQGSWFMDNNVNFEDQRLHTQHYITLSDYISIPANATLPTLSFKYKVNSYDTGVYLEIKRKGQTNWTNLYSFTESYNHDSYVTFERNLDAYKGDEVLIRFRQYWRYTNGPRVFVVDNFRLGDFIQEDFIFPYFNNFDTNISTASKNGRDHWNTEADWGISDQNLVTGTAKSGDWFLDNNPADESQSSHYNHYATMTGFVEIPATAVNPKVSFDYVSNIFHGYQYLYIQRANSSNWIYLRRFSSADNTATYQNYTQSLNAYKGDKVRFRFRQYNYSNVGDRTFHIDNFTVDQELLGIWYFEEDWKDATGHGFDLSPVNTPLFDDKTPRAKDGPVSSDTSTCFYTGYTGNQYSTAPNTSTQNFFNELTVSAWVNPTTYLNNINTILSKGDGFSVSLDNTGRIQWKYLGTQLSTSSSAPLNTWTHIAVTFKDGQQYIYINGTLAASASVSGILTDLDEDIHIAAEINSTTSTPFANRYFEGKIDELRIYRIAQNSTAIATDMDVLHDCEISNIPDHYRIEHDGTGLTCDTETVTIKACDDAACTTLNTEPKTIDFNIDGNFKSQLTFTGSTTVNFNQLIPKTISLSVANPVTPALNPTQCFNGSLNTCDMEFTDAGFIFLYGNGSAETQTIENQISGATFNGPLKIKAVENTNGVCTGLFNGSKTIELSQANISPSGTAGLKFESTLGANTTTIDKFPNFTSLNLMFNSNSEAIIPAPIYNDSGQIRLLAQYSSGGINLAGVTNNNFWVRPHALNMVAKQIGLGGLAIDGKLSTSTRVHAAGAPFELVVTALNAKGDITQNYSPNDLYLSVERTGPTVNGFDGILATPGGSINSSTTSSSNPTITYNKVTLASFGGTGISTSTLSYSEVGLLNINLKDVSYGNVVNFDIPSDNSIDVGRFIPSHFEVSVNTNNGNGEFQNTCVSGTDEFTYTGQPFTYKSGFEPSIVIEAKNAQGNITQNYTTTGYNKLNNTDITKAFSSSDNMQTGKDLTTLTTVTATPASQPGTLGISVNNMNQSVPGSQTYTFNGNDKFIYDKNENAKVAHYSAEYNVYINQVKDSDNVIGMYSNTPLSASSPLTISPVKAALRYGRLKLHNNFGPETNSLPIPFTAQYWNGTEFIINTFDNCTSFDSTKLAITNINLTGSTEVIIASGLFIDGETQSMVLKSPGAGNQGEVELEYDLSTIKWLQYDWDADASNADTNPKAKAMFGRYRGNDRVIFWREVF